MDQYESEIVDTLAKLNGSTTDFLESLNAKTLKVQLDYQAEVMEANLRILKRHVRLYIDADKFPLIYAVSSLYLNQLTQVEHQSLIDGKLPIGKVFRIKHDEERIEKKNIQVITADNPTVAKILNVSIPIVCEKKYEYWIDQRKIGYISEYFNKASLERYEFTKV